MTTTNREKPFEPGEKIEFCGERFVVEKNFGNSGEVRELGGVTKISPFYWKFDGAACARVPADSVEVL